VALVTFLFTVGGCLNGYDPAVEGLQLAERYTWLPDLGLAALAAWPVTFKPKLFYFLLLAMDGGQIAVFAVQDMLLFFLAWELELIPVYLLLAIWEGGSGNTPPPSSFSTPLGAPCLAGILLKMGGYAVLRVNVQLLPAAHVQFATLLVVLGVVWASY
jgi:NADH:ubiquinone oxidoreductase subunit 4 (subunit M)